MDREKVIKGLKCLITYDDVPCNGCPYNGSGYCIINIASDALALLKEQDKIIQNILLEKANELNDKVTTLQIETQNREIRRLSEQK